MYTQSLPVYKTGAEDIIEIVNSVDIGKFMLKLSMREIRNNAPAILENKLK